MNSTEFQVLRSSYSNILSAIVHPADVAAQLYQKSVISERTLELTETRSASTGQKCSDLMSSVRAAVKGDPRNFWTLIVVLESFPESVPVAEEMKKNFKKLNGERLIINYVVFTIDRS